MDDRQLIEDLLSALEYHTEQTRPIEFSKVAIEAAREYLRKPAQQEPVAWANRKDLQNFDMKVRTCGGPLHTVPLYTSPPHRPWVELTHEDIEEVWKRVEASDFRDCVHPFAQAIEAALRSKNT